MAMGNWALFMCVPLGIVLAAVLVMLAIIARDAIRRARCPHDDVRFIQQQRGYEFYFAEVCMHCRKASKVSP